jgi:predicted  nucleic acid-binding Zn-ribbon protein
MSHECDDCGEPFETLTRLRLHDCPGPDLGDPEQARKVVEETKTALERGDTMASLPYSPLSATAVEQLEDDDEVLTVLSLMSGSPDEETTERIALHTVAGGYVLEYFPHDGWIVVRSVSGSGKSDEQVFEALGELVQDWQQTVTDLAVDYAGGDTDVQEKLRRELNLKS